MGAAGGGVGLSLVHISGEAGKGVVGDSKADWSKLVPCNGWSQGDGPDGQSRLACVSDLDRVEPSGGDLVGTVRRGLGVVSVGVVPVLHLERRRGVVQRFTESSRARMVQVLGDLVAPYRYLGTLTVGPEWSRDGADFKARLDRYFQWFMDQQNRVGEACGRESLFWFLEFQRRGAPHVHFLYTSRVPWQTASAQWANCMEDDISKTSTKFETIRSGRSGMLSYIRKYANKAEQKEVPSDYRSVGRFWGVRGCRIRATCHVTAEGGRGGASLVEGVTRVCERACERGLLRRVRWARGEGAIYFPTDRKATLYSIGVGQEIDLVIMKWSAKHEESRMAL